MSAAGPPLWLEDEELQRLDCAIEAGQTPDIDRLLAAILARGGDGGLTSPRCAVCGQDLIRG